MLPRHLTYANVMATLAAFIALGGTSVAAVSLKRNSVGSVQIKKGAVTAAKVRDRSLLARDFKPGQLPAGARGAVGAQGPAGPQGQAGTAGTEGAPGISGYEIVTQTLDFYAGNGARGLPCPDGKRAITGGYVAADSNLQVYGQRPSTQGSGWTVFARNPGPNVITADVTAVCAVVR